MPRGSNAPPRISQEPTLTEWLKAPTLEQRQPHSFCGRLVHITATPSKHLKSPLVRAAPLGGPLVVGCIPSFGKKTPRLPYLGGIGGLPLWATLIAHKFVDVLSDKIKETS